MHVSTRHIAQLKSFGGVHPPERKSLSREQPYCRLSDPADVKLAIPNATIKALDIRNAEDVLELLNVEPGQEVQRGDLLLKGRAFDVMPIYASINGTFQGVETVKALYSAPQDCYAIHITKAMTAKRDVGSPLAHIKNKPVDLAQLCGMLKTLSRKRIVQCFFEAGISGMGGAGFASFAKLDTNNAITTLIVNAAECEPYITIDDVTMRTNPEQLVAGSLLIAKALAENGALPKIIFALEHPTVAARNALAQTLASLTETSSELNELLADLHCEIATFPSRYPSGGERQLVQILLDKEIPLNSLPREHGTLVFNVNTVQAGYHAVVHQAPLLDRGLTVSGEAIARPSNILCPIGTSAAEIAMALGGYHATVKDVKSGGSFMGTSIYQRHEDNSRCKEQLISSSAQDLVRALDQSVITASTNALLFLSERESPTRVEQACIRCGDCEPACPANLLPQELHWAVRENQLTKLDELNLQACIECGACSYVCPSNIDLVSDYRAGKTAARAALEREHYAQLAKARFDAKEARIQYLTEKKRSKRDKKLPIELANPASSKSAHTEHEKLLETENLAGTEAATAVREQGSEAQEKAKAEVISPGQIKDTEKIEKRIAALEIRIKTLESAGQATEALEKGRLQLVEMLKRKRGQR